MPPLWTALRGELLCFLLVGLVFFQQYLGDRGGQFKPPLQSVSAGEVGTWCVQC